MKLRKAIHTSFIDLVLLNPNFPEIVESLNPQSFSSLVRSVGIEDSGELIALASKSQIEVMIDDLLWSYSENSWQESFCHEKFYIFLEVLFDIGPEVFVAKFKDIDEDIIFNSLSHELLVFNIDDLSFRMSQKKDGFIDDLLNKALDSIYYMEVDQYVIFSKKGNDWDLISMIIAELNQSDYSFLSFLLERLCFITSDYVEDNGGLYEVLLAREQIYEDVIDAREKRRQKRGFVTASHAKSFFCSLDAMSVRDIIDGPRYDRFEREYIEIGVEKSYLENVWRSHFSISENDNKKTDSLLSQIVTLEDQNSALYQQLLLEFTFLANLLQENDRRFQRKTNLKNNLEYIRDSIMKGVDYIGAGRESLYQYGLVKLFKLAEVLRRSNE